MLCPHDHSPMLTEEGSQKGNWEGTYYMTEEIKVCPHCGLRVREHYEAEQLYE